MMRPPLIASLALFTLTALAAAGAGAADHITLTRDGKTLELEGRMLVVAQDGGWLFQGRDGVLWTVLPEEQGKRTTDDAPFVPLSADEYSQQFLATLPPGFEVYRTAHYLIFYDTSKAYAQWCGALFERLYMAFTNYWSRKGLKLHEPEFPLVALVFADKRSYVAYSKPELRDAVESMIGYYHLLNNRMVMYDLTGSDSQRSSRRLAGATAVNQILAQPDAERTVSTIVHEATHQIAFNCGIHARLSDGPLWFCEGVAMYFETPDLSSSKGWRGIGAVNRARVEKLRSYMRTRPNDSLRTLITSDDRLRTLDQALDAYAESWALTYFLINQYPKQYLAYLEVLAAKKPLEKDGSETRIKEFEKHFGPLEKLDREFLRYISRWN